MLLSAGLLSKLQGKMNIKCKMSYSIVKVLWFLYDFLSFLCFVRFSNANCKTFW